jgi:isocitrate dehydrogenase
MQAAITELQQQGYALPDFVEEPQSDAETEIKARYDRIKGSAVNPVLREGNSDRRAAKAVKDYAQKHPHRMGTWSKDSKTSVAHMSDGDFYGSERSKTMSQADRLSIRFQPASGAETLLAEQLAVSEGEIIDAAVMRKQALCAFLASTLGQAKAQGVLWSLHLKATMMKVSDPIMFGHAVKAYYAPVFEEFGDTLEKLRVDVNNGIGDVYDKIGELPEAQRAEIAAALDACLDSGPAQAMVDSDRGITNLHVPSDIIIDASMPAAIRESGQMWAPDGQLADMMAVIPDRCYAGIYDETIRDCQTHGAFDPTTMGSVPNVGLMAQKAEEYGSHDTTFEAPGTGEIQILSESGEVLISHAVEEGDIWRMCRVKDAAIQDWVKLAVARGRATGWPIVFWLDENRSHDAELIEKVMVYLNNYDLTDIEMHVMAPAAATRHALQRIRAGESTISVTGNVLRDYLTDLFPILELGTSAKMLSIVPLINEGGLFETGAGGSAPKHVQQFEKEGHLRWDSLGEFLAFGASLEHLAETFNNERASVLAETLNEAVAAFLEQNKSPSRKVNEIDNRGSHYYLALYWAQAAAAQDKDQVLRETFAKVAEALSQNEQTINEELLAAQGAAQDVGGYYQPDPALASAAMRPSATLNQIIDAIGT